MSEIKLDFWGHDRGVDALYRSQRRDAISRLKRRRYDEIYSSSPIKDVKLRFIFGSMYRSVENYERPSRRITNAFSLLKLVSGKHRENGCVIVSAFRLENTEEENIRDTEELEQWIKREGFDLKRLYGGMVEECLKVLETSFIVFNQYQENDNASIQKGFSDLKSFAQDVCFKYKQNCFILLEPTNESLIEQIPYYIDSNENPITSEIPITDKVWFDEVTLNYWSEYKKEEKLLSLEFTEEEIANEIERGKNIKPNKSGYRLHFKGQSIGIDDI